MDQKTEIRSYIKCRIRLNIDSKQIFNELCGIHGAQTISMHTVLDGLKLLKLGNFLLKMIRPSIAKRTRSSKKMLCAIFFNSSGSVVQVPCPSGHTINCRFYMNSVQKKVIEFYNKKRSSKGWSGVHLLHDNASSHKCEVKSFLASEKVKVLNHPPYSPDLSPYDFFYFLGLRKCFLEISIRLEVLLAALFISVANRYQKKTIYLLFATG